METLYSKQIIKINRDMDSLVEIPNTCPHCGNTMVPEITNKSNPAITNIDGLVFSLLCQCLYCHEFFALTYKLINERILSYDHDTYKSQLIPYTYSINVKYDFPDEIEKFSPMFKEIYQQAQKAEVYQLNHIAGIGYRKSIEFLVKDYLINLKKVDYDEIAKKNLSQAINKLDNQSMIHLAKAATWLGNDETHYIRKYEDKDITDMKKYIRALVFHLSSEYLAIESGEFINGN